MNKNKIHILLVDDDRQNSLLLKRFLELEGYSVTYHGKCITGNIPT